jgi:hypothetical protein
MKNIIKIKWLKIIFTAKGANKQITEISW